MRLQRQCWEPSGEFGREMSKRARMAQSRGMCTSNGLWKQWVHMPKCQLTPTCLGRALPVHLGPHLPQHQPETKCRQEEVFGIFKCKLLKGLGIPIPQISKQDSEVMPWGQISCASQCLFYSRHLRGSHPKSASPKNSCLVQREMLL